ncbi:MAG: glutathione peroxidase [Chitinophagaceae bacterium]|nr:glutathione peroxidase [Chitinophagaceae bacterium]
MRYTMRSSKLKKLILVLLLLLAVFWGYVEIINLNSRNMTIRQKILKAVYPVFTWLARSGDKNKDELSNETAKPQVSFYTLKGILNNGKEIEFSSLRGKKILLVNTASDCGYTPQYTELQKLYEQYQDKIVIAGFPANDFKDQEKGSDEEIAKFCKLNFGVSFPLMKKTVVIKANGQNSVFKWLTDSTQNGWNNKAPSWNFSKYLVNEEGVLVNYFGPAISPLSEEVLKAIKK